MSLFFEEIKLWVKYNLKDFLTSTLYFLILTPLWKYLHQHTCRHQKWEYKALEYGSGRLHCTSCGALFSAEPKK